MGAGICLFQRVGNGILSTGTGIHKTKTIEKWEWDVNLSNTGWVCGILAGPPKFCIIIVCNFSWDMEMSQEKSKTMYMQILGGKRGELWDLCR